MKRPNKQLWILAVPFFILLMSTTPPQQRVPFSVAQKTALSECKGSVASSALEHSEDNWFYTFEIRQSKHKKCQVKIDALNGMVRSTEIIPAK